MHLKDRGQSFSHNKKVSATSQLPNLIRRGRVSYLLLFIAKFYYECCYQSIFTDLYQNSILVLLSLKMSTR